MTSDVHLHTHGKIGHISLNRPKALHALTLEICHEMSAALSKWATDDGIAAVLLDPPRDGALQVVKQTLVHNSSNSKWLECKI